MVLRSSPLYSLSPFLDESGVLRRKGRVEESDLPFEQKHPIILPCSYESYVLVRSEHSLVFHQSVDYLISRISQKFHIISLRRLCKQVKRFCLPCQRQDAKACNEIGAPLPGDRIRKAPPFSITGVDYAGPLTCKNSGKKKYYILIFTCAVIRAIH